MYQKEFAGCQDTITHVPWSWYKLGFPRAPPSFAASPSSSTPWPIVILLPVTRHTTFNVQSLDNPFVRAYYKTIRLLLQTKSAPRVSNRDTLIPSIQIFTLDSVLGVHLNGIENGYTAYRASSLRPRVNLCTELGTESRETRLSKRLAAEPLHLVTTINDLPC